MAKPIVFFVVSAILCCIDMVNAQWVQTGGPFGGTITALSTINDTIYAGTEWGGIYRSIDKGENWAFTGAGLHNSYVKNIVRCDSMLIAEAADKKNFRLDEKKAAWKLLNSDPFIDGINAVVTMDSIIVTATTNSIYRLFQSGLYWIQSKDTCVYGKNITALIEQNDTLFAGTDSGVRRSVDRAATWNRCGSEFSEAIVQLTAINSRLFAGTSTNGMYYSDDHGDHWVAANAGLTNKRIIACAAINTTIVAATDSGDVFYSADSGAAWHVVEGGMDNNHANALAVVGNDIFAGTISGGVVRSIDNGRHWTPVNTGLTATAVYSLAAGGGAIIAATNNGLFRSSDNGNSWNKPDSDLHGTSVRSVMMHDAKLFAATSSGVLVSSSNGDLWSALHSPMGDKGAYSLYRHGNSLIVGASGHVYRCALDGAGWAEIDTGLPGIYDVVSVMQSGTTLLAGTVLGLYISSEAEAAWSQAKTASDISSVKSLAEKGDIFFAGAMNGLVSSKNQGAWWDSVGFNFNRIPVTALLVAGNILFVGTKGGVFLSGDDGKSWQDISTGLPDVNGTVSLLVNGSTLFAGTERKGVWRRSLSDVLPDTTAPQLTLTGDTVVLTALNNPWVEPGYSAVDYPMGRDLTDSVRITSTLDISKCGTYAIMYTATDWVGLSTSVSRTVIVKDLLRRDEIRTNQIGYYPSQRKIALIAGSAHDTFEIVCAEKDSVVARGLLSDSAANGVLDEYVRIADFTALSREGTYLVRNRGFGYSYPFEITKSLYTPVARAALKTYYYQRCSTPITEKCGGMYARVAGHPDTACPLFGDATTVRSVCGGWYDAGDYGKYVVNGGITVATLLSLHELYPGFFGDSLLNIPESGNGKDDLLDEVKWELDWFKTMQDTSGGVFFKVGPSRWPAFIMPSEDSYTRYVYSMSTASTLNFSAIMAQAGRIYQSYDPAYAADCLLRAKRAWEWANKNPSARYPNDGSGTGLYADTAYDDEFFWAAAELYTTTGNDDYRTLLDLPFQGRLTRPASWPDVDNLPLHTLAYLNTKTKSAITEKAAAEVVGFADKVLELLQNSTCKLPMDSADYIWGSNGIAGNYAVSLGYAYYVTKNQKYLDGVIATLDYLCGKNPLGYSFITGFGHKTPLHPHHRISEADNAAMPIPGFVVGGPNGGQEDKLNYPSKRPALSYLDSVASFASNEVAINWTAPLVWAAVFAESESSKDIPVGNRFISRMLTNQPIDLSILSRPSRIQLHVICTGPQRVGWKMIDMLGRCIVSAKPQTVQAGAYTFNQPLTDIRNGVYLFRVTVGSRVVLKRIQVLR